MSLLAPYPPSSTSLPPLILSIVQVGDVVLGASSFVDDVTPPYIASFVYDALSYNLTIYFSEAVQIQSLDTR